MSSVQNEYDGESITMNLLTNETKTRNGVSVCNYESANGSEKIYVSTVPKSEQCSVSSVEDDFSVDPSSVWYCSKCQYSSQTCYHCPICNKCFVERDHHCFFIGSCITRKNMKHFIVLLFYTSITSFYAMYLISKEINLYLALSNDWTVIYEKFLPVAFAFYLCGDMVLHDVLLIALLNMSICLAIFSLAFFLYNLFLVFTGRMIHKLQRRWIIRDRTVVSSNVYGNFCLIFGGCGLMNFLMPVGFARNVLKLHFQ